MSLQYKTEAYLRKAIRGANITKRGHDIWVASLPAFGLTATALDRDEAEYKLYTMLAVYVLGAREAGAPLPVIDDIDLRRSSSQSVPAYSSPPGLRDVDLTEAEEETLRTFIARPQQVPEVLPPDLNEISASALVDRLT
jgi:hypothetical protein